MAASNDITRDDQMILDAVIRYIRITDTTVDRFVSELFELAEQSVSCESMDFKAHYNLDVR